MACINHPQSPNGAIRVDCPATVGRTSCPGGRGSTRAASRMYCRFSREAATGCSHGRQPMEWRVLITPQSPSGGDTIRLPGDRRTYVFTGRARFHPSRKSYVLRFSRGAAIGCSHGRQPMEWRVLITPQSPSGSTRFDCPVTAGRTSSPGGRGSTRAANRMFCDSAAERR